MMPSAKEGVVFEREGTKVRDTVSQSASQPASQQLWIRESTQQAMTKELNGKDEEE